MIPTVTNPTYSARVSADPVHWGNQRLQTLETQREDGALPIQGEETPHQSPYFHVTLAKLWYNRITRKEIMINYQVHFEKTTCKGIKRGVRTVKARNELEAKIRVASVVEGSFGHWVNRLANEVAV